MERKTDTTMQTWTITAGEQNQRFDKYLKRRLPEAGASFLYKMLRKKNITLNGKKATGAELVRAGDEAALFLSDETIEKFRGTGGEGENRRPQPSSLRVPVVYEDEHLLLAVKPFGVLSQKARPDDFSMNEWLEDYLRQSGWLTPERLAMYKPSVCNRLDRNTGGLLLCAKTLAGSQLLAALLKSRTLKKYYRLVVQGEISQAGEIRGYLQKETAANRVRMERIAGTGAAANFAASAAPPAQESASPRKAPIALHGSGDTDTSPQKGRRHEPPAAYSETHYVPLRRGGGLTLLEALLVTGKTHQLRVHFAAQGHPIAGDPKYGGAALNERLRRRFGLRHQLLFACRVEFPQSLPEPFGYLAGRVFTAPEPEVFRAVMNGK